MTLVSTTLPLAMVYPFGLFKDFGNPAIVLVGKGARKAQVGLLGIVLRPLPTP